MLLPLRPESFKWLGLSVGTAQTVAKVCLKAAADYDDNRFQSEVEVRQENSRIAVFVALVPQQIMVLPMEDTGCVGSVHQVPKALQSVLGGKTIRK